MNRQRLCIVRLPPPRDFGPVVFMSTMGRTIRPIWTSDEWQSMKSGTLLRPSRISCGQKGMEVPRIVAGGTGSFPIFAEKQDEALEVSPGTCIFFDCGYGRMFPDLNFEAAARILTRVISCPTGGSSNAGLGIQGLRFRSTCR